MFSLAVKRIVTNGMFSCLYISGAHYSVQYHTVSGEGEISTVQRLSTLSILYLL